VTERYPWRNWTPNPPPGIVPFQGPALRPSVAVLDVRLPDGDGVSVCREVRSRVPEVACLMFTAFSDDEALLDSIMAGAAGYVLKQIRGSDLIGAVRMVLELIGEGLTNRQIGERLFVSEKTVKNYVSMLFAKLGMKQRTQAAAYRGPCLGRLQPRIEAEHEDHRPEASVDQCSVSHRYGSTRFARSGSTACPMRTPLPGIVLPVCETVVRDRGGDCPGGLFRSPADLRREGRDLRPYLPGLLL
jgi:DNA-binding CsgD family transcriptional regulator